MSKQTDLMSNQWLSSTDFVAVVLREYLRPIDGYDSPIFPPTFAMKPSLQRHPYNIDPLSQGGNICLIDSIASQANRLEPVFDGFDPRIVRKVIVTVKSGKTQESRSLLEVGHRVADAVVRFSDQSDKVVAALSEHAQGDSLNLAKDFPTSLIFGVWNSRDAGEKVPRLVQSTIRATNVDVLTRASQYVPPFNYKEIMDEHGNPIIDEKMKNDKLSKQGLLAVPVVTMPTKEKNKDLAFRVHGGVIVNGDIRHDASINLINLRALRTEDPKAAESLRQYLLGLSLLALLYPQDFNLRQGCQLVLDPDKSKKREQDNQITFGKYALAIVKRDGSETKLDISYEQAKNYATDAAEQFKVDPTELTLNFNPTKMKAALKATNIEETDEG